MNIMIKLIIYTPQDYVEAVTGHRYTFDKNICAEIGKRLEDNGFSSLWDYSLSETGHVVQNKLSVVLVDVSEIKENGKKETEYRWFEVPEGFHEKSNTVNSKFELGRMVITANANKELDIPSVLQILLARYMQGDWGNLCESDKQLNDSALKYGDRIFASYTDANYRKFWIITEADRSATTVLLPEDY